MRGFAIILFLIFGAYFGSQYLGINPFHKNIIVDLNSQFDFNEDNINSEFSGFGFECAREARTLGDRVCWANVSKFNDLPANMVAFFFDKGKVMHMRIASDQVNHDEFKSYLDSQFIYIGVTPNSTKDVGQELGVWRSDNGIVMFTIDSPPKGTETTLLWKRTK